MKNRKKNTKLVLLLLLLCITLGYAALRTGLNINGTANVAGSSWNVHFENYQMSNATNITPVEEPEIVGTTTTSISYEVDLDVPGDLYEFSVEVVNSGSMDALISLVSKYNDTEIDNEHTTPAYIEYTVTDENGDPIVDDHRLDHGDREIVKVFVKYRDDDPSVLPGTDAPGLSFDIEIEATQAEKDPQPTGQIAYTVNLSEVDGDVFLRQDIPSEITVYNSPSAAMTAFNNRTFYLKHVLGETDIWCLTDTGSCEGAYDTYDTEEECLGQASYPTTCVSKHLTSAVKETYVEFIVNDQIKQRLINDSCDSSECEQKVNALKNGSYSLRGGIYEEGKPSMPVYDANKALIQEAYGYANSPSSCHYDSDYSRYVCDAANYRVSVGEDGQLQVGYHYIFNELAICYSGTRSSSCYLS